MSSPNARILVPLPCSQQPGPRQVHALPLLWASLRACFPTCACTASYLVGRVNPDCETEPHREGFSLEKMLWSSGCRKSSCVPASSPSASEINTRQSHRRDLTHIPCSQDGITVILATPFLQPALEPRVLLWCFLSALARNSPGPSPKSRHHQARMALGDDSAQPQACRRQF